MPLIRYKTYTISFRGAKVVKLFFATKCLRLKVCCFYGMVVKCGSDVVYSTYSTKPFKYSPSGWYMFTG